MAAIYHPGVIQIVPHYNVGSGRDAVNVTCWQTAATGLTAAQLTAIQLAFDTSWAANWKVMANSSNSYLGSWVFDMSSNTAAFITNVSYTPVAGNLASGALGDNTAYLLSLKTATRYRGGHGRLYIPGCDTSRIATDGRTNTAAQITAMNTLWTGIVSAMAGVSGTNGGPLVPIVWHKKLSSAPNTTESVTTAVAQPVLATQRRRLRKVSRHRKHTP